jgi:cytochrome P450
MADTGSPETRALYRRMRAARPVHFDERMRCYTVVRYHDVRRVLTEPASFSSDWGRYAAGSLLDRTFEGDMVAQDPPRHTRLRALISRAFTPRSIADLEPGITRTAHALLDAVAEKGAMELNRDFSGVLPAMVIAELLGVPPSEHAYFHELSLQIIATFESVVSGGPADTAAQARLDEYVRRVMTERRARPTEDLTSRLMEAEIDGERLSERELLAFFKLLLVAGNTTVARLVTSAVLSLLEHPGELDRLRADPGLVPGAVEEALRYRPPTNVWFRVTAKDVELGGETLPAKHQVVVLLGSANHDEAVFPEPDRFDVSRSPNPHLALSAGPHFCLGASLARLEAQAMLKVIVERFGDLELAKDEPVVFFEGMQANGAVRLPLRFGRN